MSRMRPGRRALASISAGLTVAVFAAPVLVVAARGLPTESALAAAAGSAFVRAGASGPGADSRGLDELVSIWRDFHFVKATLAVLLVIALLRLTAVLSQEARSAGTRRARWAVLAAYGGTLSWMLAAATIVLANLQGAVAPLASVASLIPAAQPSADVGAALGDIRQAVELDPAPPSGVAGELLADFGWYHAIFAIEASLVGGLLTALALRAGRDGWRRRSQAMGSATWPWRLGLFGPVGAFFLVVASANASTWLNPAPALVASLGG
ncbi:MAG: hypothetical protein U0Q21_09760 [Dermatophilaceae bacterium]